MPTESRLPSLPQSSASILEDDSYFNSALDDLLSARHFDLCSRSLNGALDPSHNEHLGREPGPEKAENFFLERSTNFGLHSELDFSSDLGFDWNGDFGYSDAISLSLFGYNAMAPSTLNFSQNSYQSDASRPVLLSLSPPSTFDGATSDTASPNSPAERIPLLRQSSSVDPNQPHCRIIPRMATFRCSSCQKPCGSKARLV